MKAPLFYHKRPMFGLDVGLQTVKCMQLDFRTRGSTVRAYGSIEASEDITKNGVLVDVQQAARLVDELLGKKLSGKLTTNRVAMSIPVSSVFTRVVTLPTLSKKELDSAMRLEVEQSVPVPVKNLYYDYEITDIGDPENILVRMVAAPKEVIDSYVALCDLLKLDLALVQTNIRADAQLCMNYEDLETDNPYIIVDVSGDSIDVGLLDATLRLTGTVDQGGNNLTKAIAKELGVSTEEADALKTAEGITSGANQLKIQAAVGPVLDEVVNEIKRMKRFYEERVRENSEISQIVIVGGGANMPGLGDYLTNAAHIPTRVSAPWGKHISFGTLELPESADLPRYLTCSGLALAQESEVFGV